MPDYEDVRHCEAISYIYIQAYIYRDYEAVSKGLGSCSSNESSKYDNLLMIQVGLEGVDAMWLLCLFLTVSEAYINNFIH